MESLRHVFSEINNQVEIDKGKEIRQVFRLSIKIRNGKEILTPAISFAIMKKDD